MKYSVNIVCDVNPYESAISSLLQAFEAFPDCIDGFINAFPDTSQLFRIDDNIGSASGANKIGVALQPSNALLDFLAAIYARNAQGVVICI